MRLTLTDPRANYKRNLAVKLVLKFVIKFARKITVVILSRGIVILSRDKIMVLILSWTIHDIITTVVFCHGSYSITLHRNIH